MKSLCFLILYLMSSALWANENYIIVNDSKGLPVYLQDNDNKDHKVFFFYNHNEHLYNRAIFYQEIFSPLDISEFKRVEFLGMNVESSLGLFTVNSDLKLALEEIHYGYNRFIPKNAYSNTSFLKKTFEPFKISTQKELISDYNSDVVSKLYLAYANSLGIKDNCSKYIGSCDYYLCREKQKTCGVNGYFLGFAYQYCSDSLKRLKFEVSPHTQAWLVTTATCLQKQMNEVSNKLSCEEIKKKAIADHDKCYSQISFCSINPIDIFKIFRMIKPSLTEEGVIREGMQVLEHCASK
jgi:hypothetical protein